MDGVFVSLIYMKDGMFKTINNTVTRNITKTCSNSDIYKSYNVFRTE